MRSYLELSRHGVEEWSSRVIEKSLPFTHIETRFFGDRLRDAGDLVPRGADWTSQAHCEVGQPRDQFYWWLSGIGIDPGVQDSPDSGPPPASITRKSPMLFSELVSSHLSRAARDDHRRRGQCRRILAALFNLGAQPAPSRSNRSRRFSSNSRRT